MDMRSLLVVLAAAPLAQAGTAYFNLPDPGPTNPGSASSNEFADDLILDLSQGSTITSAFLRVVGANNASSQARIRLNLYTDNSGQPGALLTTTAVTINPGGPAAYNQLFDFPDVTLSSATIWAGFLFEVQPDSPPFVGMGTLPTIGSTTARGGNRLGPNSWNIQGSSGPPAGGGYYAGDRLQISITNVPAPAGAAALMAFAPFAMRRRR